MNETTEGFLLGITATLTGVLLYVFCTYGGAFLFNSASSETVADNDTPVVAAADDLQASR